MNQIIQQLTQDFAIDMKVWQLIVAGILPLSVIATFTALSIRDKRKANY